MLFLFALTTLLGAQSAEQDLAEAVDNDYLSWSTDGHSPWSLTGAIHHDGFDSALSGTISHNQTSWIETTVEGPDELTFQWKVSSEANYDYLRFQLDGTEQFSISGEVDWEQRTVSIPEGTHVIRWVYTKDLSVSDGADAGWLDEVELSRSGGPDVKSLALGKTKCFRQILHHSPPSLSLQPWGFDVIAFTKTSRTVLNAASITVPDPPGENVTLDQVNTTVAVRARFEERSELDTTYPDGLYSCEFDTPNDGAQDVEVSLVTGGPDAHPATPPRIANLAAAQRVDSTREFVLEWDAVAGSETLDAIQILISSLAGNYVLFEQLNPAETSLPIPANTLDDGFDYVAEIRLIKRTASLSGELNSAYPGLPVEAYVATKTEFLLSTKPQWTFRTYRGLYFAQPDLMSWNSNTDGDNFSLIEEFYLGLDPTIRDAPRHPEVLVQDGILTYRHTRLKGVPWKIQEILGSEDLVEWAPIIRIVDNVEIEETAAAALERIDHLVPLEDRPHYFIKHRPLDLAELTPTPTGVIGDGHMAGDLLTIQVDSVEGVSANDLLVWFGDIAVPVTSLDPDSSTITVVIPNLAGPVNLSLDAGYGPGVAALAFSAAPLSLPEGVTAAQVETQLCAHFAQIEQQMREDNSNRPVGFELTAEQIVMRAALADAIDAAITYFESTLPDVPGEEREELAAYLWRSGLLDDLAAFQVSSPAALSMVSFASAGAGSGCTVDPRWEEIKTKRHSLLTLATINRKFESFAPLMLLTSLTPKAKAIAAISVATEVAETFLITDPVMLTSLEIHHHDNSPLSYRGEEFDVCFVGEFSPPGGGESFAQIIVKAVIELFAKRFGIESDVAFEEVGLSALQEIISQILGNSLEEELAKRFPPAGSMTGVVFLPGEGGLVIESFEEWTPSTIHFDQASLCVVGCALQYTTAVDILLKDTYAEQLKDRPGFVHHTYHTASLDLVLENQPPTIVAPADLELVVDEAGLGSLTLTVEDLDEWNCGPHTGSDLDTLEVTVSGNHTAVLGEVDVVSGGTTGAHQKDYTLNYQATVDGPVVPELNVVYQIPSDPALVDNAIIPLQTVSPQDLNERFSIIITDSFDQTEAVVTVNLDELTVGNGNGNGEGEPEYEFEVFASGSFLPGEFLGLAQDGTVTDPSVFVFRPEFGADSYPDFQGRYRARYGNVVGPWSSIYFIPDTDFTPPTFDPRVTSPWPGITSGFSSFNHYADSTAFIALNAAEIEMDLQAEDPETGVAAYFITDDPTAPTPDPLDPGWERIIGAPLSTGGKKISIPNPPVIPPHYGFIELKMWVKNGGGIVSPGKLVRVRYGDSVDFAPVFTERRTAGPYSDVYEVPFAKTLIPHWIGSKWVGGTPNDVVNVPGGRVSVVFWSEPNGGPLDPDDWAFFQQWRVSDLDVYNQYGEPYHILEVPGFQFLEVAFVDDQGDVVIRVDTGYYYSRGIPVEEYARITEVVTIWSDIDPTTP